MRLGFKLCLIGTAIAVVVINHYSPSPWITLFFAAGLAYMVAIPYLIIRG